MAKRHYFRMLRTDTQIASMWSLCGMAAGYSDGASHVATDIENTDCKTCIRIYNKDKQSTVHYLVGRLGDPSLCGRWVGSALRELEPTGKITELPELVTCKTCLKYMGESTSNDLLHVIEYFKKQSDSFDVVPVGGEVGALKIVTVEDNIDNLRVLVDLLLERAPGFLKPPKE